MASIQVAFTFHFLPAYAVRLIPVQLGQTYSTTGQPYYCSAFHLLPTTLAIVPAQSPNVSNAIATAMASMSVISLMMSKRIVAHLIKHNGENQAAAQRCSSVV
jgi:hypothetical protein